MSTRDDHTNGQFSVSKDGHYIGDDGFVVPRNFDEFYKRFPKYILNWTRKRLNSFTVDQDVEDWAQDLLIHMKFLPAGSKHGLSGANGRELRCIDVIEMFNPHEAGGASEPIFRKYITAHLAFLFNKLSAERRGA
jgi:hypothetical protein